MATTHALSPYLVGCLLNFVHDDELQPQLQETLENRDAVVIVHDQHCTLHDLYRTYDLYKTAYAPVQTPSRMIFGSVNYFKCYLASSIRELSLFPYVSDLDNWAYVSGFVDMNSKLELEDESPDIRLTIFFNSVDILLRFFQFTQVPATMYEKKLEYRSTNAIDLIGKLTADSTKRQQLRQLLYGHRKIGHCVVYRHEPEAVLPTKARLSDVGYDLTIIRKVKTLNSRTSLYDTGLSIRVPFGYYVEIVPRSSLSKTGYMLSNSMGIIDRSYQGNLLVALTRVADDAIDLDNQLPFRCCQLIFRRQEFIELVEHSLENNAFDTPSTREAGGFGSTGV
jgi:deoxyuridine 5'-triphosphate nucleotidohydrolase